jgi:hypothetical protein
MAEKPFVLKYQEAKDMIANAVNDAANVNNIPCFLLENIIVDILRQVSSVAIRERQEAEALYKAQLDEESKAKEAIETEEGEKDDGKPQL